MQEKSDIKDKDMVSLTDTESSLCGMDPSETKMYRLSNLKYEDFKILPRKMRTDFDPIFRLASIFGISAADPDGKENRFSFARFYSLAINASAVATLIVTLSFAHNYALSNAMQITYSIKFLSALIMRLNMLTQCHKCPAMIDTLSQLYSEISSSTHNSLQMQIYLQCLAAIVLNCASFALSHLNLFYESEIHAVPQMNIVGYNLTRNDSHVRTALFACYSLNYTLSIFTLSLFILMCFNVHRMLRLIVRCYVDNLLGTMKNNLSKDTVVKNIVSFRRIICGINRADDVLSFCTFFAYVSCMSCFFYTLSSFFQVEGIANKPYYAADLLSVFSFSIIIFFSLTYSASSVASAGEYLRKRVNCLSEIVLKGNLPTDTLVSFMILLDNIRSTNVGMTGYGMFTITKGFVLTTVGVMITYGMVLFQFG